MTGLDLSNLLLCLGDLLDPGLVPGRWREPSHIVVTWHRDPDDRPGWWRVNREFSRP